MVYPIWKTVWQFLITLNMKIPNDPVIALWGIYPREMKTCIYIKKSVLYGS